VRAPSALRNGAPGPAVVSVTLPHDAPRARVDERLPGVAHRPRGSRLSLDGGARAAQGDGSGGRAGRKPTDVACRRARGGGGAAGWAGKAGGWTNLGPDTSPDKENYYVLLPTHSPCTWSGLNGFWSKTQPKPNLYGLGTNPLTLYRVTTHDQPTTSLFGWLVRIIIGS